MGEAEGLVTAVVPDQRSALLSFSQVFQDLGSANPMQAMYEYLYCKASSMVDCAVAASQSSKLAICMNF